MLPQQKIFYESNIYGPCETYLLLSTGRRLPTVPFYAGNKQSHKREWAYEKPITQYEEYHSRLELHQQAMRRNMVIQCM